MRGGGYQRRVMSFLLGSVLAFVQVVFGAGEKNHDLGFPRVIGRMLLEIEVSKRGGGVKGCHGGSRKCYCFEQYHPQSMTTRSLLKATTNPTASHVDKMLHNKHKGLSTPGHRARSRCMLPEGLSRRP